MNFLLELDRNSHEDKITHLIQRMLHESMPRKWRSICLPNIYKKKQSQICKSKPKYSFEVGLCTLKTNHHQKYGLAILRDINYNYIAL